MIEVFAASTALTGFLKANGAGVSRTTYAALFAITGTTYGAGYTVKYNQQSEQMENNPDVISLTYTTGGPSPAGGAETRPRNVALLACIKT